MSLGGFHSGSTTFSTTNTTNAASNEAQVKMLLKAATELLVSIEPHWIFDSRYTATSSDFVKIGSGTGYQYQAYAQFLINLVTGSQLMVFYNGGYTNLLDLSCCCSSMYATGTPSFQQGLGMSMIPGGSENTWDLSSNCTTSNLVPNDGVLCISLTNAIGSSDTFNRLTTTNAKFYMIVKDDIICVFSGKETDSDIYSGFAIGKIFGQLFNSSDNAYYSKYGAFNFSSEGSSSVTYESQAKGNNFLNTRVNSPFWGSTMGACFFRPSITGKPITYSANTRPMMAGIIWWTNDGLMTNPGTSGKTVFSPIIVGSVSADQTNYGVVPDVGYKGYLDTDFIRAVYFGFAYNTLLDNGNFLYLGGGLAIGWDPSNTVALRS